MDEELALIIKYIEEVNNVKLDLRRENTTCLTIVKTLKSFFERNQELLDKLLEIRGVRDFPQEILIDYDRCINYIDSLQEKVGKIFDLIEWWEEHKGDR